MPNKVRIAGSRHILLFFFFLLTALAFHSDKWVSGRATPIALHDEFDHEYSRYLQTGKLLYQHGLFAWYPALAGGSPSYAYQFPPYYPLCLLAPLLPLWLIYSIMKILLMGLAGWGMVLFLKERLSLSEKTALAGGLAFCVGVEIYGCSVTQTLFDYCFPLLYFLITQQTRQKGTLWASGIALCGITLFSYPVLSLPIYSSLFLMVVLLLQTKSPGSLPSHLKRGVVFWTGYVLSFTPLLYTLFINRNNAARIYTANTDTLMPLLGHLAWDTSSQLMLIFPLGGSLCLLSRSKRLRNAFLLSGLFTFASAFFNSSLSSWLAGTLLMKMDLRDFYLAIPFAYTVTAFIGLDEALKEKKHLPLFVLFGLACLLGSSFLLDSGTFQMNCLMGLGLLLFLGKTDKLYSAKSFVWGILALILFMAHQKHRGLYENVRFNQIFGHRDAIRKALSTTLPERVISLNMDPVPFASYSFDELADGRSPFMLKTYKDFVQRIIEKQLVTEKHRLAFDYPYNLLFFNGLLAENTYLKRHMDLHLNFPLLLSANIAHIISPRYLYALDAKSNSVLHFQAEHDHADDGTPCSARCTPIDVFIYNLKDTFPRAYLVNQMKLFDTPDALLTSLAGQSLPTLRNTAFFLNDSHPPVLPSSGSSAGQRVNIRSYAPDRIILDVETPHPAYIMISTNYDAFWNATVDGSRVPVYRANHTFQSVPLLSAGKKEVILEYQEPLLWELHALVPIGFGLIVLTPFLWIRKKPNG